MSVNGRRLLVTVQPKMVAEPDSSPVLSGGLPGPHGIDGTTADFVPPLFNREVVTEALALPEKEARVMARRLAREEGIFTETSAGLSVVAAIQLTITMALSIFHRQTNCPVIPDH
jgi:cysteine synthase A